MFLYLISDLGSIKKEVPSISTSIRKRKEVLMSGVQKIQKKTRKPNNHVSIWRLLLVVIWVNSVQRQFLPNGLPLMDAHKPDDSKEN